MVTKINADVLDLTDGYAFTGAFSPKGHVLQSAYTEDLTARSTTSTSFTTTSISIVLPNTLASSSARIRIHANMKIDSDASRLFYFTLHDGTGELTQSGMHGMAHMQTHSGQGYKENMDFIYEEVVSSTTPKTYSLYWKVNAGTGYLGSDQTGTGTRVPTIMTIEELSV